MSVIEPIDPSNFRDVKITDLHNVLVGQEYVWAFQVSVHDSQRMQRLNGQKYLGHYPDDNILCEHLVLLSKRLDSLLQITRVGILGDQTQ